MGRAAGSDSAGTWTRRRPLAGGLLLAVVATLGSAAVPGVARAEVDLRWRGFLQADIRTHVQGEGGPSLERLEGTADLRLSARLSKHVAAVGHARLVFSEFGDATDFAGLTDRPTLDPFRFESDALFVEFINVGIDGFDIRLGRQQLIWGTADRFHPTSNLNPLDLEDRLQFGEVIANEMLLLSFRPLWTVGETDEDEPWLEEISLQLVLMPFFKPSQIPASGARTFTDQRVFLYRADTPLLQKLGAQQVVLQSKGWTFDYDTEVRTPEPAPENMSYAARLGWTLFGVDMGVSYFYGFDDVPRAEMIESEVDGNHADSTILLTYPRKHVLGFEMATSLPFLDGLGLWAEVGLVFHGDLFRVVSTGPLIGINEVEKEHEAGMFTQAVVGMDYTPIKWLYLNVQYLYGFVDEFGERNQRHYMVAGGDFKLWNDRILLRIFGVFSLTDGSYTLLPQLTLKAWTGGELSLGALLYSSLFTGYDESKKFASRAVGDSFVFLQARASF